MMKSYPNRVQTFLNATGFPTTAKVWFVDSLVGIVIGLNAVIGMMAFASLFSTISPNYAFFMTGLYLFGAMVIMCIGAVKSGFPAMIALPTANSTSILLVISSQISLFSHSANNEPAIFATSFVAFGISTLLTGIAFLTMGYFRKGNIIRFIPYPVMCGFMAGMGLTLFKYAILNINTNVNLDSGFITLASILFAVVSYVLQKVYQRPLFVLIFFFGGMVFFNAFLSLKGISYQEAVAHGWILAPTREYSYWQIPSPHLFSLVNWHAVYSLSGLILMVVLVNIIGLLMNVGSLETATHSNLDFDHELRVSGKANLLAAVCAGISGSCVIGLSMLAHNLKGSSRLIGAIGAAFCLFALALGVHSLMIVPKFLLFGMLMFIALGFVSQWLLSTWSYLNRVDYVIVLAISIVIYFFGFFPGVLIGLFLSVAKFVFDYSKINIIRNAFTGDVLRSCIVYSPREELFLRERGKHLLCYSLHGYLFFGTAYSLVNQTLAYIQRNEGQLRTIIFDFHLVDGMDVSAIQTMFQLKEKAMQYQLTIILIHINHEIAETLHSNKIGDDRFLILDFLDQALAWAEKETLKSLPATHAISREKNGVDHLIELGASSDAASVLISYFEREDFNLGDCIVRQGDPAEKIYLIKSGQVSVLLGLPSGKTVRLQQIQSGNIVGEMAFYTSGVRSASVFADCSCTLLSLSHANLVHLEKEHPDYALILQRVIIRIIAERLKFRNHQVDTFIPVVDVEMTAVSKGVTK